MDLVTKMDIRNNIYVVCMFLINIYIFILNFVYF